MKKIAGASALIFFLAAFAVPLAGAAKAYLFGQGLFFYASGSESDYIPGKNDFPLTSQHQAYGPGFRITAGSRLFYLGLEGQYNFRGTADLTDPSDGDRVTIETYPSVSGFVLAGINVIQASSVRIFINGGAGIYHALNTETRKYMSAFGYETLIEPPGSRTPFAGFGGLGMDFRLNRQLGFFFEGRYQYIDSDQPQTLLSLLAGVSFFL
jgi:hypothetical protein